jgi:hypothetical protein
MLHHNWNRELAVHETSRFCWAQDHGGIRYGLFPEKKLSGATARTMRCFSMRPSPVKCRKGERTHPPTKAPARRAGRKTMPSRSNKLGSAGPRTGRNRKARGGTGKAGTVFSFQCSVFSVQLNAAQRALSSSWNLFVFVGDGHLARRLPLWGTGILPVSVNPEKSGRNRRALAVNPEKWGRHRRARV